MASGLCGIRAKAERALAFEAQQRLGGLSEATRSTRRLAGVLTGGPSVTEVGRGGPGDHWQRMGNLLGKCVEVGTLRGDGASVISFGEGGVPEQRWLRRMTKAVARPCNTRERRRR
jgi:hypothetical protein